MEIGFADTTIPETERAELEDVLRGIATEDPDCPGDRRTGRWVEPVERITVLRRIPGGRSGADVLDVELERSPAGRIDRRVIKIDAFAEIATEWRAFRDHLAARPNALVTPVDAVSGGVLDGTAAAPDRAAIVYYHVAAYGSAPGEPTRTLEDLVRDAVQDGSPVDEVVTVLDALLSRMTATFYADAKPTPSPRKLQSLNRSLGPDIVLEVDRPDGPRKVKYGDPVPEELAGMRRYQSEVLAAATAVDAGPDDRKIGVGDVVHLVGLSSARLSDGCVKASLGESTVMIRQAAHTDADLRLADLCACGTFEVIGRTVGLRAQEHWQRIERAWPDVERDQGAVGMSGVRVEHPFRLVHALLTEDVAGRVTALTHGDLNPRNVLRVGDQIFLIDFAETGPGRPLLADFAWLELCLMRDVIAPVLGWPALARLQRTLAAASRLGELVAADAPLLGVDPATRAAFAVLWSIRKQARASYPAAGRQPWWRDYLTQLTLSGCRTLKWDEQCEPAVQAVVACGGVAAEWLDGSHPYRRWSGDDVTTLIEEVTPRLRTDDPGAAEALAELVRAADDLGEAPEELWTVLEVARAAVTVAAYAADAKSTLVDLRDDHELFISLNAYIPLEGQLGEPSKNPFVADAPITFDSWQPDRPSPFSMVRSTRRQAGRRRREQHSSEVGQPYGFGRRPTGSGAEVLATEQDEVMRLVVDRPSIVVLGGAGSGKSTVARELQFQLATAVHEAAGDPESRDGTLRPLMPVLVRASDVVQAVQALGPKALPGDVLRRAARFDVPDAMLVIGAVHLAVDAFNELTADSKKIAAGWIQAIHVRFRHTPVLVCHRTFEYEASLLPYPTVALLPVTAGQARRYIADMLRLSGIDDHADRSANLSRMLLDNPEHPQIQDLAKTPLFLWMLVKRYVETAELPTNIGALFADFAQWYIEERHHDRAGEQIPARHFPYPIKIRVLETLGRYLVEHGNVTKIDEGDAGAVLAAAGIEDPAGVLNEIVGSEMLYRSGESLQFLHQSFQEYFAALIFAREADDERLLRDRAMVFAWREPLRIMLGFSGGRPDLALRLIQFALLADPRFAAKLLRASETPPPVAVETFIAAQRRTLTQPDSGEHDWQAAAQALADYGTPDAMAVLEGVAIGDHLPAVRVVAFGALVGSTRTADEHVDRVGPADLAATAGALLADDTPVELRAAAVRAVGVRRLVSLTLNVGDLVDDRQPWPVVEAAADALRAFGIELAGERRERYLRACEDRLIAIENVPRHGELSSFSENGRFTAERLDLLKKFTDPIWGDLLLRRRFSYGLASEHEWSQWLKPSAAFAADRVRPDVRHLLVDAVASTELLAAFADPASDDLMVAAAAHRLISDKAATDPVPTDGTPAGSLVRLVSGNSSATRLLAVAAAVSDAGLALTLDDELPAVEALVRDVVDQFREDLLEPLAALIQSLHSHRLSQVVLARVAEESLQQNAFTAIARWPFYDVLTSMFPTEVEMSILLLGDHEQVWASIDSLASKSHIMDAGRPESVTLTEPAMAAFDAFGHSEASRSTHDVAVFYWACAVVGRLGFIDSLIDMTADPVATRPVIFGGLYGTLEIVPLAGLLCALGYLGRIAHENGDLGAALRAYEFLVRFDPAGAHPSVGRGRLVGLGYLGDWVPLLSALDTADPMVHGAAKNTIKMWVPGPFSPSGYSEPRQVAGWIAARLARPDAELTAGHRSTLSSIKAQLETKLGRYIVAD